MGFTLGQPPLQPRVSRAGIELVKRFEGLRRKAARLADGGWTIGYGHTLSAREGAEVGPDEAEALLIYDLRRVAEAVQAGVYTPLTQNQFDALCAFAFNIGLENFAGSAVLRRLNEGNHLQAAAALELWRKAALGGEDIVVDALVRRRAAEKALFLTPPEGFRPSPTPVLKVLLDPSLIDTLEQRRAGLARPVVVEAPLDGEFATAEREPPPFALEAEAAPDEPADPDLAYSPALAAAANVRARLDRLLAEDEPDTAELDLAEPEPEPEPEIETGPETEPQPQPQPQPQVNAPLDLEPPVEQMLDAPTDGFPDDDYLIRQDAYIAPVSTRRHRAVNTPMLVIALIGLAMFSGSVVAMFNGNSSFAMLCIGLGGVIFMVIAAIRFLVSRI
jgi:lysozyme